MFFMLKSSCFTFSVEVRVIKKILIIAHFTTLPNEFGDNRFSYIAEQLAQRGHDVTLVTSSFSHFAKKQREIEAYEARYKIVLLHEPGYTKNFSVSRLVSHKVFEWNLKKYLRRSFAYPDIIYYACPGLGDAMISTRYGLKHGIKSIIDVQDVWPDALRVVFRSMPDVIFNLLTLPFLYHANKLYKLQRNVLAVSYTYLDKIRKINANLDFADCVYIGAKRYDLHEETHEIAALPLKLVYIGTVSYSYDIDTIVRAARICKDKLGNNIEFYVIGAGPELEKVKCLNSELENPVAFLGKLAHFETMKFVANCHIGLHALRNESQGSVTNKIGEYFLYGLPVLNSGTCEEVRSMIEEADVGFNYLAGDAVGLSSIVLKLYDDRQQLSRMSVNAKALGVKMFDREIIYQKIYELIEGKEE